MFVCMRSIKVIVASILILGFIIQLFSFLIPSEIIISRANNLNVPSNKITPQINNFNNWFNWNSGFKTLKNYKISSDGKVITADQVRMEVTETTDSTVQYLINQMGTEIKAQVRMIPQDTITVVQWQYNIHLKWYPWEKFKGVFADNVYGPLLDSNITALNKYITNNQ